MRWITVCSILLSGLLATNLYADGDTMKLMLKAPITTWDEAVPLGNGILGGLLWGTGNTINLSLDRGDLWDERLPDEYKKPDWNYNTIRKLKAAGNQREISRRFDTPYSAIPYPTKLPGGRLVITMEPSRQAHEFTLDMAKALGTVETDNGRLECFFAADKEVAMVRVPGKVKSFRIIRPRGLDKLGYPPAKQESSDNITWMVQDAAKGLRYAVVAATRPVGDETLLAVTIQSNSGGKNPLTTGKRLVSDALASGFDKVLQSHLAWWRNFWNISSVTIPDERLQRHYNLVKYFYGAASRSDAPPMPLQGLWTRDDGNLPPWKGDYHHDLNTQMTYLAYHEAGLTNQGLSFVNFNLRLLPQYRRFAANFYGVKGAVVPGVSTLAGQAMGGWSQYALSPINGLWVGQTFYLHWRYTMNRNFLARQAYPWLSAVGEGVAGLLQEKNGKLYLPLSSSPEIHENSLSAWLQPNSNYDLALMQWSFEALAEMADVLGLENDKKHWLDLRRKLDDLAVDNNHVLMFAKGEPFNVSHRHHSHAMAIHPLGRLNIEMGASARQIINATLEKMQALGTQAWCGYSFSWFAAMLARCNRPQLALDYLQKYERAFTLRNGFHVNGDQLKSGLSRFTYRPFTLEGNFLAMQAIQEMLLQSWAPEPLKDSTALIRIFPAMPSQWQNAAFDNLRAEGAFVVSARRTKGATVWFRVKATVDGPLRIKDNFAGKHPQFSKKGVRKANGYYETNMKAGEILEATL